jgi:drug/metabolite transporter (DMT)-like permease
MEPWIAITVAAAFFQNLRSALQQYLTDRLSAEGATYVRFLYALPFVALYVVLLNRVGGVPLPAPNAAFIVYDLVGGITQIGATFCLIRAFALGNFAVGTAYSKTDTLQAALFGVLLLGERISAMATVGMTVSLVGVFLMSASTKGSGVALRNWISEAAGVGLASGALFALSSVCYRGAALALPEAGFVMQAAYTQVWVTVFQSIAMGIYFAIYNRAEFVRVIRAWRVAWIIGASGMAASSAWFAAMAIQQAAYVRAVGQIELVFTFFVSLVMFRERIRPIDYAGVLLLVAGIVILLAKL